MAYPIKWSYLFLLSYVCVCTAKYSSVPSMTGGSRSSPEKKAPHIHKHNGELTSVRSSDIIKEEGRYFLRQLFKRYGTGREMDIVSLEVFLENLGYATESDVHQRKDNHGLTSGDEGAGETDGPNVDNGKDNEKHDNRPGIKQGKEEAAVGRGSKDDDIHSKSQNNDESGGQENAERTEDDYGAQGKTNNTHEYDSNHVNDEEHVDLTEMTANGDIENGQDARKKQDAKKHRGRAKGKHGHKKKAKHEIGDDNSGDVVDDVVSRDADVIRSESKDKPTPRDDNDEGKQSRKKHRSGRRKLRKGSDAKKSDVNGRKRQKIPDGSADSGTARRKRSAGSVIFHSHDTHTDCMTAEQLIKIFHFDEQQKITQNDFLYISPAIVYQLTKPQCRHSRFRNPGHLHPPSNDTVSTGIPARVWGYSFVAVLVISLVGLLCVAVIPIMQKVFYNQLLQFLVALAVGALTGDAMLHLLPHAIAGEEDPVASEDIYGGTEDSQKHGLHGAIWKGFCGLMGIYFFFIIQQVLTIVTGVRNRKRKRRALKLANKGLAEKATLSSEYGDELVVSAPVPGHEVEDLEQSVPLKSETGNSDQSSGHGHSHNSGPLPTSVSAMAWMVILGDGIHNFSDGLAIGAAFASSITSGLSTSIAVFCHELPHEIGDFAVLLKAGMSIKQAVMYNVVSSVLCLVGMLIGVALGNVADASIWIFAGVGGMFIYISLVTMLPELMSVSSDKPVRDLILQCLGISTGAGIMLLIAIYEDDLKKSFG